MYLIIDCCHFLMHLSWPWHKVISRWKSQWTRVENMILPELHVSFHDSRKTIIIVSLSLLHSYSDSEKIAEVIHVPYWFQQISKGHDSCVMMMFTKSQILTMVRRAITLATWWHHGISRQKSQWTHVLKTWHCLIMTAVLLWNILNQLHISFHDSRIATILVIFTLLHSFSYSEKIAKQYMSHTGSKKIQRGITFV